MEGLSWVFFGFRIHLRFLEVEKTPDIASSVLSLHKAGKQIIELYRKKDGAGKHSHHPQLVFQSLP